MIAPVCKHENYKKHGKDRYGNPRFRCKDCGATWTEKQSKLLGNMYVPEDDAKLALRMLTEGNSIRPTERTTGINRNTIMRLLILFGNACQKFLNERMRGLNLTHLQFDEQWSWVGRKQAHLTVDEKAERSDVGDVYIWTCIDQKTKLMPSFLMGKRSADNARRFMTDVAKRLTGTIRTPATITHSKREDTARLCKSRQTAFRDILKPLTWLSVHTPAMASSSSSTRTPTRCTILRKWLARIVGR